MFSALILLAARAAKSDNVKYGPTYTPTFNGDHKPFCVSGDYLVFPPLVNSYYVVPTMYTPPVSTYDAPYVPPSDIYSPPDTTYDVYVPPTDVYTPPVTYDLYVPSSNFYTPPVTAYDAAYIPPTVYLPEADIYTPPADIYTPPVTTYYAPYIPPTDSYKAPAYQAESDYQPPSYAASEALAPVQPEPVSDTVATSGTIIGASVGVAAAVGAVAIAVYRVRQSNLAKRRQAASGIASFNGLVA
ncbi:UNVERIFIED_CONTAM: hypothetical protein HDU68_012706 [Siphonaria sp. JEL0065]|nr:hypothetical protein HDU68_012706 [Siphonaria sp. JEL0065]